MKTTNPHMSESENKLASLKECLARENTWVKYHTDSAEQIKAQIKALEEALAPKQGDIYENTLSRQTYILARVGYNRYCLINLETGERFNDPTPSLSEIFASNPSVFVKLSGKGN
jgi:hypothetical protein